MSSTHSFVYEHCDVPPGVSLVAWRRAHSSGRRRRGLLAALRRRAARRQAA